jgi:hypothetical protein
MGGTLRRVSLRLLDVAPWLRPLLLGGVKLAAPAVLLPFKLGREPLRTFDALHLAVALEAASGFDEFGVVTLDERLRAAGGALGLQVLRG